MPYFYDNDDVYTLSVQLVTSSRYKSHPANLVVENPSEDSWATSRFTPMLSGWQPNLRSRHLEVVGTRKNGRARRRHYFQAPATQAMANQSFWDCPRCPNNNRYTSWFDLPQFSQFSRQVLKFFNFLFSLFSLQFYASTPDTATSIIWQAACCLSAATRSALLRSSYYYYHYYCCCFRKPSFIIVFGNKRGIREGDEKEK